MVTIGTLEGTATAGTGKDYTATSLASITIPANSSTGTGTITITPIDDKVVEGNETIIIPGTTTAQVGLTVNSATITLKDLNGDSDDPNDEDKADLYISGPSANVSEGGNAEFTVTLSAEVASEVEVAWSASFGADAPSSDLDSTSGTVTFAANSAAETTETITIAVADDMLSEKDEAFTVTLGAITTTLPATQITLKSDDASATATIAASDPVTVNISGPSNVNEGDATSTYTVSLSPDGVTPTDDLKVDYTTADGTATAGTDYTAKSGTLTFTNTAAGSQTFTVQTTEDTFDDDDEDFTVTISSPSGGGGPAPSIGTASVVTTTIDDDDDAISGITLTVSPTSVGEDDAKTEFTVTASLGDSTTRPEATVVTLSLGGTAGSSDYTVNTSLGSITIPASTTSATGKLELTPTDDTVVEGDETIIISGTTTTQVGLDVSDATITLTDDDKTTTGDPNDKDNAELSIAGPTSDADEGSDATFTVTLSAAVSKEVTVAWTAAGNTSDYTPTSGTVDVCGELGGWVYAGHRHRCDGRRSVRDCGDVHGDAG